jgi:hypothetical protein
MIARTAQNRTHEQSAATNVTTITTLLHSRQ